MTGDERDGGHGEIQWQRVRARLRQEIGATTFNSWFRDVNLLECAEGRVVLGVGSRLCRDWISTRYTERIRALWQAEDGSIDSVSLVVDQGESRASASAEGSEHSIPLNGGKPGEPVKPAVNTGSGATDSVQAAMGEDWSRLDPRLTFENFVTGKPNEFAHAAARRVAESDSVTFNPLFLYGGVGLGKTHLMHAIAWQIKTRFPDRKVIYLSAEKFMYQFIRALRSRDVVSFKELFRSVDVLMVDDVQFIAGKDSTQEEFFHTFNALVDQNRQVIVSGDRMPSDIDGLEERMRSRLGWGLVAEIHETSYELRLSILQAKVEQLSDVVVPQKVLEYLAHKITSNVRELEGALNRVVAGATLMGHPITLETAHEHLSDLVRSHRRQITIEEIQKKVADYYRIKVTEMMSARRAQNITRPRQVAMYLSKILTARSLPEIGRRFSRDHTTVIHAVKRVEELCAGDESFAEDIRLLRQIVSDM